MEPDKRYRILVLLQRTDRPRYWDFFCPVCQFKVGELTNNEVVAMQDLIDTTSSNLTGVSVRCDGRYRGGRCDTYYFFSLSDNAIRPPVVRVTINTADGPH